MSSITTATSRGNEIVITSSQDTVIKSIYNSIRTIGSTSNPKLSIGIDIVSLDGLVGSSDSTINTINENIYNQVVTGLNNLLKPKTSGGILNSNTEIVTVIVSTPKGEVYYDWSKSGINANTISNFTNKTIGTNQNISNTVKYALASTSGVSTARDSTTNNINYCARIGSLSMPFGVVTVVFPAAVAKYV